MGVLEIRLWLIAVTIHFVTPLVMIIIAKISCIDKLQLGSDQDEVGHVMKKFRLKELRL